MSQEKLAEAYARLGALKSNLPDFDFVPEKYVQEFHAIMDALQLVSDLRTFRVPPSELQPRGQAQARIASAAS